ncbi:hypothetical protein Hamer_G027149 [Homarus americanus]|uniref:Uncharacterized protein n=1 Tax=Homarus americanus TaxID=6706 RepID=A0A8J5JNJ8_HOMAM|nr:hypothetical protein Hamer_G027149 [Homarus americanus]
MWIITASTSLDPLSNLQTETSIIQITIEEMNIECGEGVLYHDGYQTLFLVIHVGMGKPHRRALCTTMRFYIVQRKSHNHACVNNKPVCLAISGSSCDIPVCPNKCSEAEGRGKCDSSYGLHLYAWICGEDCSIVQRDHQVVVTQLFAPDKIASSLSHLTTVLPRMGHSSLWITADHCGYLVAIRCPWSAYDIQQFDTHNNSVWQQVR